MNERVRNPISVVCRTNLDGYKSTQWPIELQGMPAVGHCVESSTGRRLRIVAITWLFDGALELELTEVLNIRKGEGS